MRVWSFAKTVVWWYSTEIMRSAALSPEALTQGTTEGIVEMRGLLTPGECNGLAPPADIQWEMNEPNDPARSWSNTAQYRFGEQATAINPNLQTFLGDFRDLVQGNAAEAGIPELEVWGSAVNPDRPVELIGMERSAYVAKWHRTLANHQIGWHTDDTFEQARGKREFGVRALGMMVAVSLTEHGGDYEYAPANTPTHPGTLTPIDKQHVKRIEGIGQGDAIGFITARDRHGDVWVGSWPLHRFIAALAAANVAENLWRDSLVVAFQDVSARSLRTIGMKGVINATLARMPGRRA